MKSKRLKEKDRERKRKTDRREIESRRLVGRQTVNGKHKFYMLKTCVPTI